MGGIYKIQWFYLNIISTCGLGVVDDVDDELATPQELRLD